MLTTVTIGIFTTHLPRHLSFLRDRLRNEFTAALPEPFLLIVLVLFWFKNVTKIFGPTRFGPHVTGPLVWYIKGGKTLSVKREYIDVQNNC